MKRPLILMLLVIGLAALGLWSCARNDTHANSNPATGQGTHDLRKQQVPATSLKDTAEPMEQLQQAEASDELLQGISPLQNQSRSLDRFAVQSERGVNDRDLGRGAGKEGLGDLATPNETEDREDYQDVRDNPFIRVAEAGGDASTFALDVDTASYSNVRRFLAQNGQLPPRAAVRIEELINYFPYAYAAPAADAALPFGFITTVADCPWEPSHRLVRVAIKGRVLDHSTRPPLNLVFLVDCSGSMRSPNKIDLVRDSLALLVGQLDARDSVAIVTYAGSVGTALPATPGDQHMRIREAIRGLGAGGSTNGEGGITAAYAEAAKRHAPGVQSRVVLCTDGDFNVGISDQGGLQALIEDKRKTGIFLSVYGFGMGNLQDHKLETLANHGNGVYGYIDSQREARKIMVDEALGATVTIAKDAKVQVFFNPAEVAGWRLIGYENRLLRREDFNDDSVDAGDIGAGHTVTVLYEIVPAGQDVPASPAADPNPFTRSDDYPADIAHGTLMRLRLRAKQPDGNTSILQEEDIPSTVAVMDEDFRFASSVALVGMLLRQSPHIGAGDWTLAIHLASNALGQDPGGLRAEFLGLIGTAKGLK